MKSFSSGNRKEHMRRLRTKIQNNIQKKVTKIKQHKPIKKLPTILTLLNVVLGFVALISIYNEKYLLATLFILSAFIFDILDGFKARWLQVITAFGIELDSLAD